MWFGVNGELTYTSTVIIPNQWYHLVMIFDGSLAANNLKLYVNGAPDRFATISQTRVPRYSVSNFYVGAADNADPLGFNGLIDEVRVYNRALSASEVMDLYNGAPAHVGPVVGISGSLAGNVGVQLPLTGSVTPTSANPITVGWSVLNGPGNVSFWDASAAATTASFAQPGSYVLRLSASDGAITTWANITGTIAGSLYNSWASSYGLSGNNALAAACPAGDGVSNLMKYALGLNPNTFCGTPTDGTKAGLPLESFAGSTLSLTYQKDTSKTDISYLVECGVDLKTWSNSGVTEQIMATNGAIQTVKASVPMAGKTKQFIRLKVNVNP